MMQICRASSSLPFGAPMVKIDGVPMLDGGIADSIPVRKAIADGFDYNIVILTRHKGYYKEERTDATTVAKLYYHRYPMLVKALSQRAHVYNRTLDLLDRLEQKGMVFVIRPTAPCVSRTERDLEKLEDFTGMAMRRPSGFIRSCTHGWSSGRNVSAASVCCGKDKKNAENARILVAEKKVSVLP